MRRTSRVTKLLLAALATTIGPAALLTTAAGGAEAATASSTDQLTTIRSIDPADYESQVQHWINRKRKAHGLRAVRFHRCTDHPAESWTSYLASHLEFYHQSLDKFFSRCDATYAGETLARGAVGPKEIVRLWMHSPDHRHILLSRYANRIGLGARLDSRGDWTVTADFTRI